MLTITNLTKTAIDEKLFAQVAKIVLKSENRETKENVSVVFVDSDRIKELNKKYRNKNKPTDVLSFSNVSGFKFQVSGEDLGEIVICPQEVRINAEESGSSFKKELVFVFIHGILHLLGYDHERNKGEAERMREREKKYLGELF